jgi:hypothetical protein
MLVRCGDVEIREQTCRLVIQLNFLLVRIVSDDVRISQHREIDMNEAQTDAIVAVAGGLTFEGSVWSATSFTEIVPTCAARYWIATRR